MKDSSEKNSNLFGSWGGITVCFSCHNTFTTIPVTPLSRKDFFFFFHSRYFILPLEVTISCCEIQYIFANFEKFMHICNPNPCRDMEYYQNFISLKPIPISLCSHNPPGNQFLLLLLSLGCSIISYTSLESRSIHSCVKCLLRSIFLKFIHIVAYISNLFYFISRLVHYIFKSHMFSGRLAGSVDIEVVSLSPRV